MSNAKPIASRLPLLIILSILIALVVYLLLPILMPDLSKDNSNKKNSHQRVVTVKTTQVIQAPFIDMIEAIGTVKANEQVLITSNISDFVDHIAFDDGQLVNQGDVIVKLNAQEETAKVKELEANLSESKAQLKRFKNLLKRKATSKSEVDQQEAKTKAISAQLQSARTKVNDLTIKAPFKGILGFREISVGAYINAGSVITSLDDLSVVKVDFSLPERFLTTIKKGQTITATNTAYGTAKFTGKIISIDSRIDPITRTLKVRAQIPNQSLKLRPGMLLVITVVRNIDTILQLPESTIIPIEDKHFVFVISANKATKRSIKIGRRQPGIVEVISGLKEGEQVVTEGALKLRNGVNVKVLEH